MRPHTLASTTAAFTLTSGDVRSRQIVKLLRIWAEGGGIGLICNPAPSLELRAQVAQVHCFYYHKNFSYPTSKIVFISFLLLSHFPEVLYKNPFIP